MDLSERRANELRRLLSREGLMQRVDQADELAMLVIYLGHSDQKLVLPFQEPHCRLLSEC